MEKLRRANIEVMVDILGLCKQPQCKTRILYNTNLSWKMAGKYLSQLRALGLLKTRQSRLRQYETTEKGLDFLERWESLMELISQKKGHGKALYAFAQQP